MLNHALIPQTMNQPTNSLKAWATDQLKSLGIVMQPVAYHDGKMAFSPRKSTDVLWFRYDAFTEVWKRAGAPKHMSANAAYIDYDGTIKRVK